MLVADDHAAVHAMFAMLLRRLTIDGRGFTVMTAESASQAISMLDQCEPFDVVVADLHMESADAGEVLLQAVARHPHHRSARRVLHTGEDQLFPTAHDSGAIVQALWSKTGLTPTTVRERLAALLLAE